MKYQTSLFKLSTPPNLGTKGLMINTFVNDIQVIKVKRSGDIKQVKAKLATAFEMVDISPISFYFSHKFKKNCTKTSLKLLQLAYINKNLAKYYLN